MDKLYSNDVQVRASNFDFVLEFRLRTSTTECEPLVTILMSPQHAKALAQMLNDHVKTYEEAFGVIGVQPNEEKLEEMGIKFERVGNQ